MEKEKELWLESINAKAFPEPIRYVYTFPGYHGWFNLSERYINETPLKELQETYKQNEKHVWSVLHSKNNRRISVQMLNIFKKPFRFKFVRRQGKVDEKLASKRVLIFEYVVSISALAISIIALLK